MVAHGEVVMLPAAGPAPVPREPRVGPGAPKPLAISLVRVDGASETVSGSLEPYRDPACGCMVTTTFVGSVHRDRIEGTFVTQGGGGHRTTTGRWRVDRVGPGGSR